MTLAIGAGGQEAAVAYLEEDLLPGCHVAALSGLVTRRSCAIAGTLVVIAARGGRAEGTAVSIGGGAMSSVLVSKRREFGVLGSESEDVKGRAERGREARAGKAYS